MKKDLKKIAKVKLLRKKGLTYRAIAKKIGEDLKSVFRWANYPVDK